MKQFDKRLAKGLAELFYPLVEVTLFNLDGSLQEIFNPFSSVKEDQQYNAKNTQHQPHFELLTVGRKVKSLIYSFAEGHIRIRYDLSHFTNLQEQLNFIIQTTTEDNQQQSSTDQWKEAIDHTITKYLSLNKINMNALTTKQTRELITKLHDKGLFDFKESSTYVASKLQISRATVYNYLKTAAFLKKVHIHQVDAFTNERFGGNPAGVVLDADLLDEQTMRKITRELNLSETAFVLPSKKGSFQMRYFTPSGHELGFCGHSTVGTLYMIAKENRFGIQNPGTYTFQVETLAGILTMHVTILENDEIKVAYETPEIKLQKSSLSHEMVAQAAGFDKAFINQSFPVMYEESNKDLFVVIQSLDNLKQVECDPKSLSQFSKQHEIVALCLLTQEAFDQHNQFHMRCFAPVVGIPEDPFTGSVLGGLTAYVDSFKLLPKDTTQFHVEQGHFINRPGVVTVEFLKSRGKYSATVFAQAVHCFSTEITL